MRRVGLIIATLCAGIFLAACDQNAQKASSVRPAESSKATAASDTNRQVYHARGVVKEIVSPTRARIAHEAIPGYMPAMTMPLDAKNTNELANVKAGDQITFDMVVTGDDGWIEKVTRVGETPLVTGDTNQGVAFSKSRVVEPLSVGDPAPDYPFVTEEGKSIRLSDFKGQALGITFIFTRCPFPTFCPRMTSNFEKAAAELAKAGGPTNWHLLSISFDPEFDTPERLKAHAQKFQRDPTKWNFVTSEKTEIQALTEQLGLIFMSRNGTIEHNLRTAIIDRDGKLRQIYIGNEWDIEQFVAEMKKAATGEPASTSN
jgi:protein SCO1/2